MPAELDVQSAERQETTEPIVHAHISITLNEGGLLTMGDAETDWAGGLRSTGGGPRGKTTSSEA